MLKRILYKINNIILLITFGLMIFIPLIMGIIQDDKTASNIEKRNLATLPELPKTLNDIIEYPKRFNQYYSDHFGFREELTHAYFKNINKIGQQSSLEDVTYGQDGWLFLGSTKPGYTDYGNPFAGAMNVNIFTQQDLKKYVEPIVAIDNWLKEQGIAYLFVIAPNKHTIYFDKLPEYVTKKNISSAMDQLFNYLKKHTNVMTVDLRAALNKGKKNHQIYYKSDTHWNHYGANIAQYEIIKKIGEVFPFKISANLLADIQFKIINKNDGDLARFAGIQTFNEPSPQPIFDAPCNTFIEEYSTIDVTSYTTKCSAKKLKILIYRDSFFTALQPYFSENFFRATYLSEKINKRSLKNRLEKFQPDIVINEIVERELP